MKNIFYSIIISSFLFTQSITAVNTFGLNIEENSSKTSQACHQIVRRAAFDIGSGQIKAGIRC